jgi:uncharacterized SAM-binding protein YcdF (DUF218 family)
MICLRRCMAGLLVVAAAMLAFLGMAFTFASVWLLQGDAPKATDAIVVLAGDVRRTLYAADLFRKGYAPMVLVSRPARDAREKVLDRMGVPFPLSEEISIEVLLRGGVPLPRIEVFGVGSLSTYEEARVLGQRFAGQSPHLLVVTSPYHVRRARMILADALPGADLRVVATPYEEFPDRWWTSQDAARDLLLEMAKLAFYLAGGRFSAAASEPLRK